MEKLDVLEYTDRSINKNSTLYITHLPCKPMAEPTRSRVLDYLCNVDFMSDIFSMDAYFDDPFDNTIMQDMGYCFEDDKYVWSDRLIFYVRDHDIVVPDAFIAHVNEFFNNGGKVKRVFDWRIERKPEQVIE